MHSVILNYYIFKINLTSPHLILVCSLLYLNYQQFNTFVNYKTNLFIVGDWLYNRIESCTLDQPLVS